MSNEKSKLNEKPAKKFIKENSFPHVGAKYKKITDYAYNKIYYFNFINI